MAWGAGAGVSESRPRGWLGRGRRGPRPGSASDGRGRGIRGAGWGEGENVGGAESNSWVVATRYYLSNYKLTGIAQASRMAGMTHGRRQWRHATAEEGICGPDLMQRSQQVLRSCKSCRACYRGGDYKPPAARFSFCARPRRRRGGGATIKKCI